MLNKEHLGTSALKASEWDDVDFAELEADFVEPEVPEAGGEIETLGGLE